MKYLGMFAIFCLGVLVGSLLLYVLKIKEDFQTQVFNQSLTLSKYHEIAQSYFKAEPNNFKDLILCRIIEEDEHMARLSVDGPDSGFFVNSLYGGKDILKVNSHYLFDELGLSYESYKMKCDSRNN